MLSFSFNFFLCVKTYAIIGKLHQQVLSTGKGVTSDFRISWDSIPVLQNTHPTGLEVHV